MAFHVRDERTDALVRQMARKRGIGITEVIREVFEEAAEAEARTEAPEKTLKERLAPLLDRLDRLPRTGLKADKAFFDDLSGQADD